ncbi:MAG: FtsW/RodA/SpoVE family cell cycle protein [Candidatus Spyradocola sp.]|jgi:cell division protein FtsW
MRTADKAAQQRKKAERRRSHINDPAPKRWNLRNMWVIGQHLPIDWGVVICTIALAAFGSLMVLSASSYSLSVANQNAFDEFETQLFGMALGGAGFFAAMHLDYRWLKQRWIVMALCGLSFVMLGLVILLPKLGELASFFNDGHLLVRSPEINGARRWLVFGPPVSNSNSTAGGLSIQPAEILKVAIVIYIAYYMDKRQSTMQYFWRNNFACLCVVGVLVLEVLAQPNLSTSCLLVFVTLFLLMAGGMRKRTLIVLMCLALVAFYILARFIITERWSRIVFFLDPWSDASDQGYQLVQSYYALGNGGWFGTGLGLSKQKHNFLPYASSDFIFAIVGEELGFVGAVGVLGVFLTLIYFGYRIAVNAVDRFGTYLALGLTSVIALQVVINVLVVTGFAPTTGIPLPFFTSGGTTMAIFLTTMGLLVSVSRRPVAIRERVAPPALIRLKERWMRAEG